MNYFKDNKNFYPTPDKIILDMTEGLDLKDKVILEPQAGKANILKFIKQFGPKEMLACELDQDLSYTVKYNCDTFLCRDFFDVTMEQVTHVDYIIANPPFSDAVDHVLHCFSIMPAGCEMRFLVNHDSYTENKNKKWNEVRKTVAMYSGSYRHIGQCFQDAERKTSVSVGLIRVKYPENDSIGFGDEFEMMDSEDYQGEGLVPYNRLKELVNRYKAAVNFFDEVNAKCGEMSKIGSVFSNFQFTLSVGRDETVYSKEAFAKDLQKKAWRTIFAEMDMKKFLTSELKNDIDKFVEQQTVIPFTYKNVMKMIEIVVGTNSERMDKAYITAFDNLTQYYKENRYGREGWVTNNNYMLNKKFILPRVFNNDYGKMSVHWNGNNEYIDDLVRILCHITGTDYNSVPNDLHHFVGSRHEQEYEVYDTPEIREKYGKRYDAYLRDSWNAEKVKITKDEYIQNCIDLSFKKKDIRINLPFGKWFEFGFFRIKGFKKGTAHVEFLDDDIWARFNQEISRIKGFQLPPEMAKKSKNKKHQKKEELVKEHKQQPLTIFD
jgi:hypothetical protein